MMTEGTRQAFEEMKERFGNRLFETRQIFGICESTFFKYYREMGCDWVTVKKEVPLQKVIDTLNDCAGEDCYDCSWHYSLENGKVFKETYFLRFGDGEEVVYKMLEEK